MTQNYEWASICELGVLIRAQKNRNLRIGMANNFRADQEVSKAFVKAVETIRNLGYPVSTTAAPFDFGGGISNIESDRKAIARQAFKDIDILLLPTTTTTVPTVKDAGTNPQALSPENTVFANYYGLPAISIPCGFIKMVSPWAYRLSVSLGMMRLCFTWRTSTKLQLIMARNIRLPKIIIRISSGD